MQACKECPFRVSARGELDWALVQQMQANAEALEGFPCHMRNPGNDILSCPSKERNANDCVGFHRMQVNVASMVTVHPDFVGCFDEMSGG